MIERRGLVKGVLAVIAFGAGGISTVAAKVNWLVNRDTLHRTAGGSWAAENLPTPTTLEEAIRQRDAWVDSAMFFSKNEEFYRGIVTKVGEMFGEAAKTSDDGSIQQDVLALKVPELVKALIENHEAMNRNAYVVEAGYNK